MEVWQGLEAHGDILEWGPGWTQKHGSLAERVVGERQEYHRSMYNGGGETGGTVAVPGALQSQRSKIGVLWEE